MLMELLHIGPITIYSYGLMMVSVKDAVARGLSENG